MEKKNSLKPRLGDALRPELRGAVDERLGFIKSVEADIDRTRAKIYSQLPSFSIPMDIKVLEMPKIESVEMQKPKEIMKMNRVEFEASVEPMGIGKSKRKQ